MYKSIHDKKERKFHIVEQNTDEWLRLRSGKFTASSISNLLMGKKTKGYLDTIKKCAVERLSSEPVETEFFGTGYTERGHELEFLAVKAYEELTFSTVDSGGFYEFTDWAGASPDGNIVEGDKNNGLECKCVGYKKFLDYIFNNELIKADYWKQVQAQIYVCGFEWVDIAVYYPNYRLLKVRIEPDEEMQTRIENEIELAKIEVEKLMEDIKKHRKDYKADEET